MHNKNKFVQVEGLMC